MTHHRSNRSLLIMGAAAALALSVAQEAHAYQGTSVFMCHVAQHDFPHVLATSGNSIENRSGNPGSRNMIVSCPVHNDSTDLASMFVTVRDANNETSATFGEFRVRGCVTDFTGGGFSCSPFATLRVSPSLVFMGTNSFPLPTNVRDVLNVGTHTFRFLEVSIPRPGVNGNSGLIGYEAF